MLKRPPSFLQLSSKQWHKPRKSSIAETPASAGRARANVTTAPLHFNLRCKNCDKPFALVNVVRTTPTELKADRTPYALGYESDYCSVDCQSSHALKSMYTQRKTARVYQDLKRIKQMQDDAYDGGVSDMIASARVDANPLLLSVEISVKPFTGAADLNSDFGLLPPEPCVPVPTEKRRGNLFREFRKSICVIECERRKVRRLGIHNPNVKARLSTVIREANAEKEEEAGKLRGATRSPARLSRVQEDAPSCVREVRSESDLFADFSVNVQEEPMRI
jgi:hypothetical protein